MPEPLPDLHIPPSSATVSVSIINTGGILRGATTKMVVEPNIDGHEYLSVPCFAFLIENKAQSRTMVFDLGLKKDGQDLPPPLHERVIRDGWHITMPKTVRELLDEQGGQVVDTANIEAVIWSHTHLDHVGDVGVFEPKTQLIVGPGTKKAAFPGWPTVPDATFREDEVAGRFVHELDFSGSFLRIGGLAAIDYFADGSFYFLDAPGHCPGHICGLARVTSDPDSFVFMGGDAFHHGGELRPSTWHPLPRSISPNPFVCDGFSSTAAPSCPGEMFSELLPEGPEKPFYRPTTAKPSFHLDPAQALETIRHIQKSDAHDNILVVSAHDVSILNVVDFFPATANDFMEKGWVSKMRWAWLADFAKAVGKDEDIPKRLFGDARAPK